MITDQKVKPNSILSKSEITSIQDEEGQNKKWTKSEQFAFYFSILLFGLLSFPWPGFFRQLVNISSFPLHYEQLLDVISYLPVVIPGAPYGLEAFYNLLFFSGIALVGAVIWSGINNSGRQINLNLLNYLLRAFLRYKIGISLFAFGLYLLFQQHLPYPSLSNLHTNYGDLFSWKVYFQTTAINPEYQSFLGLVEIVCAFLIIYPRTTSIGAGIALGLLGNVLVVNLFYDIGDLYFVSFLLLSLLYLLAKDVPKLADLLIYNKWVKNTKTEPFNKLGYIKKLRTLGIAFSVLLAVVMVISIASTGSQSYKYPSTPGIAGTEGYYEVTEFILNQDTVPFSVSDPSRWRNVIFEKWTTLSILVNKPVLVEVSNGNNVAESDFEKKYEIAGAGGRHYYHYQFDSKTNRLVLLNKNSNHLEDQWNLNFVRINENTLVLEGTNNLKHTVRAKLEKKDKKYFMFEGRRSDLQL